MKICLVNIVNDQKFIYKDFNGNLGTRFEVGESFLAKLLEKSKGNSLYLPLMAFGYATAIFKKYRHDVNYAEKVEDIGNDNDLLVFFVSVANCGAEKKALAEIRKRSKAKLCLIGPFAGIRPDYFAGLYDFIINGEPEKCLEDIASANSLDYSGIVDSPAVENLDRLSFPDWDFFDVQKGSYFPSIVGRPVLPILASRGCMFGCDYCAYKANFSFRPRSVDNVIAELVYLKDKYKLKGVLFRDPIFSFSKSRTIELAEKIISSKLDLQLACETRIDCLDEEILDKMAEAGFVSINVGIESFSDEVLISNTRQPIMKEKQEKIINYCKAKGIEINAFYMFGFPDDSRENIRQTLAYAKKLNTSNASFNIFTPYPGTKIYDNCQDRIMEHDLEKYSFYYPVIRCDNLSQAEILELKEHAFVSYYFRFAFILSFAKNMFNKLSRYAFIHRDK